MKTFTEKIGNRLNELLEKNNDAEKGFRKAAAHSDHAYLKQYFYKKAQQRKDFGQELKAEIMSFGQQPKQGTSTTSKAHRTWMNVKAIFSAQTEEAMLEEAIRGEKASIEEYDDVLIQTTLPPSTETLLRNQQSSIQAALSTVQKWEESY